MSSSDTSPNAGVSKSKSKNSRSKGGAAPPKLTKQQSLASLQSLTSALPFAETSLTGQVVTPKSTKPSKGVSDTSTRHRPQLVLPQTRIKLIMKTSPEVEFIGSDSLFLITKATELFIDHMASAAFSKSSGKSLQYKDLAVLCQSEGCMDFLKEIVPVKMSARAALLEIQKSDEIARDELLQ